MAKKTFFFLSLNWKTQTHEQKSHFKHISFMIAVLFKISSLYFIYIFFYAKIRIVFTVEQKQIQCIYIIVGTFCRSWTINKSFTNTNEQAKSTKANTKTYLMQDITFQINKNLNRLYCSISSEHHDINS